MNGPLNEQFGGPVPCLGGFCIENAPAAAFLWSIAGASRASLWAVGEGALLHLDGGRWDTVCGPLEGWILRTAYAASDRDVWIGGQGTIGHFDGQAWSGTPADPGWNLFEIWGDAGEAFATYSGTEGGILRWDGAKWAPSWGGPNIYASDLSVWGDGTGRAWGLHGGTVVVWDGARWADAARPFNLNDVWAPRGGDPWFAGYTFRDPEWWVNDAAVATLVSGSYAVQPLPGYWEARWVCGSAPDDVWVGTSGTDSDILRWDGVAWTVIPSPSGDAWRVPLVLGPADAWMTEHVFDSALQRYVSRIMRFDGAAWSESLVLNPAAVSAVVTTPSAVWAAGADGLWRFDGSRWTSVHGPLGYSVQLAVDGERVWAMAQEPGDGSTIVVFWDGANVITHHLPNSPAALHASGGHAWIATQGSTRDGVNGIVHHWDGSTWNELDTATTMSVRDLWASGPDDLWAVGAIFPTSWTSQTGVIAHWDGVAWSRREMKDYGFRSVWGADAHDVWLSGDTEYCQKCPFVAPAPVLLRWDGARLTKVASLAFDEITGARATEVWGIVSDWKSARPNVVLHRFDGSRWSATVRLEAPFRPFHLHVAEDGTLWGVDGGRLLRRAPSP